MKTYTSIGDAMKELGEVFKEYAELNKRDLPMLVEDQSKKLIEEVVRQTHKATNQDIAQGVANNVPFFIRAPKSKRRGKQTLKQQIEDAIHHRQLGIGAVRASFKRVLAQMGSTLKVGNRVRGEEARLVINDDLSKEVQTRFPGFAKINDRDGTIRKAIANRVEDMMVYISRKHREIIEKAKNKLK